MKKKCREPDSTCNALLYRFVFKGIYASYVVFLLCASFVLSGVHVVFANEADLIVPEESPPLSVEEFIATEQTPPSEVVEDFAVTDDPVAPDEAEAAEPETIEQELPTSNEEVSDVVVPEEIEDTVSSVDDTTPPQSDIGGEILPDEVVDTASSTATSTVEVETPLMVETNSDNFYQFNKDECVRVEDGSFYCGEVEESDASEVLADSLFSAPDSGGDLEIFLRYDGEETQVSHNDEDDAAPYYDAKSHTIVWHRLINDRYQIVVYDIEEASESILTSTKVNNMEPSRYGNKIAWQRWVDSNWEIIFYDGNEEKQISNSITHDVAPLVYENYVLWNSTSIEAGQQIVMYDISSGDLTYIKDADGAAVQNPRMVLVYETAHANGDVITKGFDLQSQEVVPLGALPREVPTEIPESDQTGETRALIQGKSSGKDSEIVELDLTNGTTSASGPAPEPTATSSTAEVIAVPVTQVTVTEPVDLVIPQYVATSSSETPPRIPEAISDIVIPAFSSSDTE